MTPELQVIFVSMWDVRVGMPLGIMLGLPIWETLVLGLLASLAITPFILLFPWILKWSSRLLPGPTNWVMHFNYRYHQQIQRLGYWGLFLFVAFPLPGTGPWSGAIIAGFLQLNVWKSLVAILAGLALSGTVFLLFASAVTAID